MNLPLILGHKLNGEVLETDLTKLLNLLIGGYTGYGKSNLIINIVDELAARKSSDEVKFLLIDPKMVEFNNLASRVKDYLYHPIPCRNGEAYNDMDDAFSAIFELCKEMDRRISLLKGRYSSIEDFNRKNEEKLPYIVLVIDEYADIAYMSDDFDYYYDEDEDDAEDDEDSESINELMEYFLNSGEQSGKSDSDEQPQSYSAHNFITSIVELAQCSHTIGIHMIISTQRPSKDIVNGIIKASMPARIAFKVEEEKDSIVLLDRSGAENLEAPGDFIWSALGEFEYAHASKSKDIH